MAADPNQPGEDEASTATEPEPTPEFARSGAQRTFTGAVDATVPLPEQSHDRAATRRGLEHTQPLTPLARSGAERTFTGAVDATQPLGPPADSGQAARPRVAHTQPIVPKVPNSGAPTGFAAAGSARAVGMGHVGDTLKSRSTADAGLSGTITVPTAPPPTSESEAHAEAKPVAEFAGVASLRPFGPYSRVEPLAAQGSMGVVAKGFNEGFGRWELIKFLRPDFAESIELRRQFTREGRVLARLAHPHVVQVFAMYELDGSPCLAMEFLEGQSLGDLIAESPVGIAPERAHELMLQAARGLAAAHEVGLLHRDIKPDNMFVTSPGKGRIAGLKLIDFGLAAADRARKDTLKEDPSLAAGTPGGTPLFLAPEIWKGRDPTQKTDLYALGVSFFLALAGRYPCVTNDVHELIAYATNEQPPPSLGSLVKELPLGLVSVIDQLIDKDPSRRPPDAETVVAQLVDAAAGVRPRQVPASGPYRGLEPYTADEADVFFGRGQEVAEVTERLRTTAGVVLVGPSGAGKSSLAMAGVLPAISAGALGGTLTFRALRVEPRLHPLQSLAAALEPMCSLDNVGELLARDPRRLAELLQQELPQDQGLVILVDQLEELATVAKNETESERFAEALASLVAAASPRLRVLATLRADLMDRLFSLEPLRHWLTRGFYPVRPLLGEALLQALDEPARVAGYQLEDTTITDQIARDVANTRAGLPLASFAMQRWWQDRDQQRGILPTSAWQKLGGLAGALVQHADQVLDAMTPEERQAAERILPRLVSTEQSRDIVPKSELTDPSFTGAHGERALIRLVDSKLLIETAGQVELVHDALISNWPRLLTLLMVDEEDRRFHERVARAAREWDSQERPLGALWDGDQAARLERWFKKTEALLNQVELDFVARVRQRRTRGRRLRRGLGVASVAVVGGLLWLTANREHQTTSQLSRVEQTLAQVEQTGRRRIARLEAEAAENLLISDPTLALARAHLSRELEPNAALEGLAVAARARGVYAALPQHAGGAVFVAISGHDVVSLGIGRAHFLALDDKVARAAPSPPLQFDSAPTAVTSRRAGKDAPLEAFMGDADGRVWKLSEGDSTPHLVARCNHPVRELYSHTSHVIAHCADQGSTHHVVEVSTGSEQARPVAAGTFRAVSVNAVSGQVLTASSEGELLLTTTAKSTTEVRSVAQVPGCSALAAAGDASWLVGTEAGKLSVLNIEQGGTGMGEWQDAGLNASVQRIVPHPERQAYLVHAKDGTTTLLARDFSLRARFASGSRAHAWLPRQRAVALAAPGNDVRVLALENGAELARLRGAADTLSWLAADSDWLLSASLDGGVRAYPLNVSVPRSAGLEVSEPARCALSPAGTWLACAHENAILVRDVRNDATPQRLTLRTEQKLADAPPPPAPPASAPGDAPALAVDDQGHVAVQRESQRADVIDNGQALTVSTPGFIDSLHTLPGGGFIAASSHEGARQLSLLTPPWTSRTEIEVKALLRLLAPKPDGSLLLVAEDGSWHQLATDTAIDQLRALKVPKHGATATAVAVAPESADIAFGTSAGELFLMSHGKLTKVAQLSGRITCIAWPRSNRALVVGAASRESLLIDPSSGRKTTLFQPAQGIVSCGYDSVSRAFTWLSRDGFVWRQSLDTTPLALSQKPIDARSSKDATLDQFNGLFLADGS